MDSEDYQDLSFYASLTKEQLIKRLSIQTKLNSNDRLLFKRLLGRESEEYIDKFQYCETEEERKKVIKNLSHIYFPENYLGDDPWAAITDTDKDTLKKHFGWINNDNGFNVLNQELTATKDIEVVKVNNVICIKLNDDSLIFFIELFRQLSVNRLISSGTYKTLQNILPNFLILKDNSKPKKKTIKTYKSDLAKGKKITDSDKAIIQNIIKKILSRIF